MRQRCASVRTFSTLLMRLYSSHFVFEAPPPSPMSAFSTRTFPQPKTLGTPHVLPPSNSC